MRHLFGLAVIFLFYKQVTIVTQGTAAVVKISFFHAILIMDFTESQCNTLSKLKEPAIRSDYESFPKSKVNLIGRKNEIFTTATVP